jgi:hypothetical protein
VSERIEYEFAVSGNTSEGEIVLAAPEYLEGHLDWFSFIARPGTSLGAAEDISTVTTAFLPAPVSYRGMPSPRFWEFEDAKINFAKVEANPQDLARLLLVKFALEYGNDWFLVPIEIDAGSLCQIRSLIVANTFGERMLIPHTAQVDGVNSPLRSFALSQDAQHLFFLPPVLGPGLQSAPGDHPRCAGDCPLPADLVGEPGARGEGEANMEPARSRAWAASTTGRPTWTTSPRSRSSTAR